VEVLDMARDEFDSTTKQLLADRVGNQCANPNCRKPTSGPQLDPLKALNIGVAAHITAASAEGPRYDPKLTAEERKSPSNGIWLCQSCAKLIDNDVKLYTSEVLYNWRRISEEAARASVETGLQTAVTDFRDDVDLIRFYSQCLDRPAFQDPFEIEGSMEAFSQALDDTVLAINTGFLRTRDRQEIEKSKGKSFLKNPSWRERMDTVVLMLRAIRSRYDLAVKTGDIHLNSSQGDRQNYYITNDELSNWMNSSRQELLAVFSQVCTEAGIQAPQFSRSYRRW
jgi:hypothetical protein